MDWTSCSVAVKDSQGNPALIPTIQCIFPLFNNIINWALSLAGIIALLFILIAAIRLITSRGDQKQVQGARLTLTYAILGLLLVFLSFFIINFISYITGATCIRNFSFDQCGLNNPDVISQPKGNK